MRAVVEKAKIPVRVAGSASATAVSLLIMVASNLPLRAADNSAQSGGCLTRTQAEQTWPHSHLYWHTERHCWDVTPVGQYRRGAYVPAVPAPIERQTTPPPVNYRVIERDGGTVWVKPPADVTTYYPSLMKGQDPESQWLTPTAVVDWPLLIDIDNPNRFAPWDRRIGGIMNGSSEVGTPTAH